MLLISSKPRSCASSIPIIPKFSTGSSFFLCSANWSSFTKPVRAILSFFSYFNFRFRDSTASFNMLTWSFSCFISSLSTLTSSFPSPLSARFLCFNRGQDRDESLSSSSWTPSVKSRRPFYGSVFKILSIPSSSSSSSKSVGSSSLSDT